MFIHFNGVNTVAMPDSKQPSLLQCLNFSDFCNLVVKTVSTKN